MRQQQRSVLSVVSGCLLDFESTLPAHSEHNCRAPLLTGDQKTMAKSSQYFARRLRKRSEIYFLFQQKLKFLLDTSY